MYVRAATWWTIFRIGLEERLVYRADFALGTLMRFLPIITQIFLWAAVFESVGDGRVAGYTYSNMVAYYLLTMMSRAFSSMPGLTSGVAAQIRSGEIKKFLVQPVDLIGFMFLNRIAHKLTYYTVAFFSICPRVLPLPRFLRWLAARGLDLAGLEFARHPLDLCFHAADGIPARFFSRDLYRADRFLVSRGDIPAVCLHAVKFLSVRTHVSPGYVA